MSLSSSFDYLSFQRKIQNALKSLERVLELERQPRLADDVDHTYGAKYGLVDLTTNAAIIALANCLDRLGLDAAVLKSIDKAKPATLRFESSIACSFLREAKVDVPVQRSYEEEEVTTEGGNPSKSKATKKVMKAVNHVTEFHWEVEVDWSISIYSGTSIEDKNVIKSRKCKTTLITQSRGGLDPKHASPVDLSLTWLLRQIDTAGLNSTFKVDREHEGTRTPRRNDAVDGALNFALGLGGWCARVEHFFGQPLDRTLKNHNPALPKRGGGGFSVGQIIAWLGNTKHAIANPILPLMEEGGSPGGDDESLGAEGNSVIKLQATENGGDGGMLLSTKDMSRLLDEHVRTLGKAIGEAERSWSSDGDGVPSSPEAALLLICGHIRELSAHYADAMSYVESMTERQLVAAVGRRLTPRDLDKFVKYHNARLLSPMPQPFSHAIRRPEHYPVGLLSIETLGENECIHSHTQEVNASSSLKCPLSAATVLDLTGRQHLHGYMNHRFGSSHKGHQLVARARQFSAFILVIGNMTDGSTLDPKDAIIVQNKDELLIPLLLEELPTAKEFKDAVKSLSPEQQRFARAYRNMQLASSVFGICVIQIKPQLEELLGLPADALDKEMKLTQDLMELFIEFQVPSDMLSYNGFGEDVAAEDKISNVRDNVKSVMDVIDAEKEKQLKAEQAKADMAMEQAFQRTAPQMMAMAYSAAPDPPPKVAARGMKLRAASAPKSAKMSVPWAGGAKQRIAPPPPAMAMCAPEMVSCSMMESCAFEARALESSSASAMANSGARDEGRAQRQSQHPVQQEEKKTKTAGEKGVLPGHGTTKGVDFTLIPQALDAAVEKSGGGDALRSTTIKTGDGWVRQRQENLLTASKRQRLTREDVKKEKNKAFDLLDALSRSGSLPIAHSDLHVVVAVTHCFDRDVMSTVVCDNVNPIEKLERSTLLLATAVHGVPARELIGDDSELRRLEGALPLLLGPPGNRD